MAKTCKPGYYWCYTDKKCKKIPVGWHVGRGGMIEKDDEETKKENGNGESSESNGGENGGGVSEGTLHKWFKGSKSKDGKGGWVNVVTGGTCASDEPGEGTPKCVSSAKRASMSKAERLSAARRKKAADPGQQQKTGAAKPTYVSTDKKKMKEEAIIETKDKKGKGSGKKDACYHKVKSRYSVWPSAYASGALVKCRKVGAANWGNKTDSKDHEYSMARSQLSTVMNAARRLKEKMKGEGNIEAWVQSKITKAADYLDSAADYVDSGEMNEAKKCWPGYKKKGTQKLFGKTYNRCVKANEQLHYDGDPDEYDDNEEYRKDYRDGVCPYCGCDPCECEGNEMNEAVRIPAKTGNLLFVMVTWRGKGYSLKMFFPQAKRPTRKEVELEVQKVYPGGRVRYMEIANIKPGEQFLQVSEGAAWTKKAGKSESGGLNEKGRKSYERENPGSDLKAPSKKVGNKRRASFCARMKGMKKKLTSSKTANDPDSRINKSLRAWNC